MAASHGRIFICYRRRDTRALAGRLNDSLANRFGEDRIFMDVDAIEPGLDFTEAAAEAPTSSGPGCRSIRPCGGRGRRTLVPENVAAGVDGE